MALRQQRNQHPIAVVASPPPPACPLLALPLELRLDIYAYLLCSYPDPIFVSPRRRQVYLRRAPVVEDSSATATAPAPGTGATALGRRGQIQKSGNNSNHSKHRRRRRNKPIPLPPDQRQPYVEVLRTCRQVNEEATPVLYGGKNTFVVAWFRLQPYHPPSFFPWYLRQSTLVQIRCITFQSGCYCAEKWVAEDGRSQAWTTTGARLARKCFPFVNYGSSSSSGGGGGGSGADSKGWWEANMGSNKGIGDGGGVISINSIQGRKCEGGGGGGGEGVGYRNGTAESKNRTLVKGKNSTRPVVVSSAPSSSLLPLGRRAKEAYDMVANEIMRDWRVVPTVCLTCHLRLLARRRSKNGMYMQQRW
ncbi:hypothetical protein F4775DRAFT_556646 [Biscogniauxia sp. FL1348]|nr:hypothetical protein F4775DRAFT_556646 [Biscogniauxia sp. FL1348]